MRYAWIYQNLDGRDPSEGNRYVPYGLTALIKSAERITLAKNVANCPAGTNWTIRQGPKKILLLRAKNKGRVVSRKSQKGIPLITQPRWRAS